MRIIGVRELVCRFGGADGSIDIKHSEIVFYPALLLPELHHSAESFQLSTRCPCAVLPCGVEEFAVSHL
jgi:hypothetical protein